MNGWRPVEFSRLGTRSFQLPKTPFARLGVVHAASSAGDTLVTIVLAKTLFFVTVDQARPKILTYLLLTLAPFTVVSPFIGPLIDRFAGSRRWIVVGSGVFRAVLCLLLVKDLNGSLLLFPEAFVLLVVSKGYAIAKTSIVPEVVRSTDELVRANSRLALIGGLAGFSVAPIGALVGLLGAEWVAACAAVVFAITAVLAVQLSTRRTTLLVTTLTPPSTTEPEPEFHRRQTHGRRKTLGQTTSRHNLGALRLATLAMSVQRGLVGLVTFLLAFSFKREGAPTWWLGIVAGAGIAGGLIGSVVAPKLVDRAGEARLLLGSAVLVCVVAFPAALRSRLFESACVAGVVGLSAALSRLAFDALIQRESGRATRGATFARLETRFQLSWVLGALIPVAVPFSRFVGFLLISGIGAAVIVAIVGGEQSLQRIDSTLAVGARVWRRPIRPTSDSWNSTDDD